MTQQEQVIDALVRARGLVERGWCQGWFARDADGYEVAAVSPQACRFCALGAIRHATNVFVEGDNCIRLVLRAGGNEALGDLFTWNDAPERTQADVLALYDRAIALAREETP